MIKNMAKVNLFGKVVMYILENIGKMKEVGKEQCIGQMEANTKVIGLKEFNMATGK